MGTSDERREGLGQKQEQGAAVGAGGTGQEGSQDVRQEAGGDIGSSKGRRFSTKFYLAATTFVQLFTRVGTTVVMGRFLTPEDYGMFTLVLLAPSVVTSIGDLSVPMAMIQLRHEDDREVLDTGLALLMVLGGVQFVAVTVGSVMLYLYNPTTLHDWRVVAVGVIFGASAWMSMFYSSQMATLNRQRRHGKESKQNLVFGSVAAVSGIGAAASGLGVFALALQLLIAQMVAGIASLKHVPARWPRAASWRMTRRYAKYCAGVAGSVYLAVMEGKLFEYAVVGGAGDAGKAKLGEWNRGQTVQSLFAQNVCVSIDRIVFPAICAAQHDLKRARELSARHFETLSLLTVFLGVTLSFMSADMVRVVLGPGWGALPPLLAVLAWGIPMWAMYSAGQVLCTALGRTTAMAWWTLLRLALVVPLVLLLPLEGVLAVAVFWVAARAFCGVTLLWAGWRVTGLPGRETFLRVAGILGSGAIAAMTYKILYAYVGTTLPLISDQGLVASMIRLVGFGTLALGVYLAANWFLARDVLTYVRSMSKGR